MMKLTELILQLHTIMLEKGNLDVWVENDGVHPPELNHYSKVFPAGIYID